MTIDRYANRIRDAAADRLRGMTRFYPEGQPAGPARIKRTFILPVRDSDIPCLLVYLVGESMPASGDYNAGQPDFDHALRLVVSALIRADSIAELDDWLDAAAMEILEALLCDPTWLAMFDGITQIDRSFGLAGQNDNTKLLMAESRIVFTIALGTTWPPRGTDDFSSVQMRTPRGRVASYSVNPED